ncbi:hypothetical protein FH972_021198 [Carpinus fangiana]|uniref:Defect at low temperature protein 1 n=1 Tax=Carpinus fangiana TaxID=176857 RepID=A0A5N6KP90_9ROSI|nr:hypothetical protein FH972_021198 [Carpinus fangiana]
MKYVNMNARAWGALLFNFIYRFAYTALLILCVLLLAITPVDHIYQTFANDRLGNIFVVGGTVVVTFLLALFIYFSRLYTNRTILASIPKPYIPVEQGEVIQKVHKVITKNRQRSAIIAWDSRPRDLRAEFSDDEDSETSPALRRDSKRTIFPVSAKSPPWGTISHPGWSNPSNSDIPSIQFDSVVGELPHLIEAKAVSLAPPDPAFVRPSRAGGFIELEGAPPDARVVAMLQRPPTMGLRDYMLHLNTFGLVDPPALAGPFLAQYEYARFSGHALTEDEFRKLMDAFSDILAGMVEPDVVALEEALSQGSTNTAISGSSASSLRSTGIARRPISSLSASTSRSSFRSVIRHSAA